MSPVLPSVDAPTADASADALDVPGLLSAGFPSPDLIDAAVAMTPAWAADVNRPARAGRAGLIPEGPRAYLEVAAGVIALRATDDSRHERLASFNAIMPPRFVRHDPTLVDEETARLAGTPPVGLDPSPKPRRPVRKVRAWSRKSRALMVRRVSELDYRPMLRQGVPVMVTLTYPGEWRAWARSGVAVKSDLHALLGRWQRRWGSRPSGLWKMEYQRRGAAHFHLFVVPPADVDTFRRWLAQAWVAVLRRRRDDAVRYVADVYGLDGWAAAAFVDDELRRASLAGTAVDRREGLRMRDPRRLAVYFLKHGVKTADGKGYQNDPPEDLEDGCGRFWGYWRLERVVRVVELDPRAWYLLRRTLRRWARSRGRRLFTAQGMAGGWASFNDAPSIYADLARWLT